MEALLQDRNSTALHFSSRFKKLGTFEQTLFFAYFLIEGKARAQQAPPFA